MSVLEIIGGATRPHGADDDAERRLRVVPDPPRVPSKAPFVVLVLGILGFGLIGLLLLNTSLQQNSFVLHDLEGQTAKLEQRQGVLEQRVATLQAPDNLAREAERLGMVPNPNPAFLRLSDGKVFGTPSPATPPATPLVPTTGESEGGAEGRTAGQPVDPADVRTSEASGQASDRTEETER